MLKSLSWGEITQLAEKFSLKPFKPQTAKINSDEKYNTKLNKTDAFETYGF